MIVSILSILIAFLWSRFEKSWWRHEKINKLLPSSLSTPVLEGRWEGTLIREGEPHDFAIEIIQTFTTISCKTFSKNSYSVSIAADFIYDEQHDDHRLFYLWEGKTKNAGTEAEETNKFTGVTLLNVNSNQMKLIGEYFTNRQPKQTRGSISVSFQQKELKHSFL